MGHEVFISYSSQDKLPADAACAVLESQGVRCWMAPRDILPGEDWGQSIIAAINGCKVMVLIFSSHANQSQQVKREVERAIHHGLPLIPVRIEDVLPANSLEYFLGTSHWLDAFSPPLEQHLLHLAATIKQLLNRPQDPPSALLLPPPRRSFWRRRLTWVAAAASAVVGAFILWAIFAWRPANSDKKPNSPSAADVSSRDGGIPDKSTTEVSEKTEEFDYTAEGQAKTDTRRVLTLDLGGGVTMEFVRIPHGKFMMGSADSDKEAAPEEKPRRGVTITNDFYLGKYLVTQQQYKALMGNNPSYFSESGDGRKTVVLENTARFPVDQVTWIGAQAFCQKLSNKTGWKAGLPTEAQWEYACRAGTTTRFPSGDELTAADANFDRKLGRTSDVRSYPANPFGLYDMTGNVWEWCSDYWDPTFYKIGPKEDPENLTDADILQSRVLRGGSWFDDMRSCRAAYRHGMAPGDSFYYGLRVRVRLD